MPSSEDDAAARKRLRDLLLEGAESPPAVTADADFFARLRDRVREAGRP